ncbi:choice-of-anchor D domain-containing protein [Lacihabitans sp. LS3-19]|uniref:beta strand repeat-containing protein n=1 Tax=Lacihabitans sp. LS3-19 TaxID=2487335 RepID=UPI0020CE654E|nr:FG-GAP-like repeat-containing protein [Lacihabitans sp. LS3-19]MCP9769901.1 choice-of-anchor D domain-containing protein [Lacihabitans sp. LS3-19]
MKTRLFLRLKSAITILLCLAVMPSFAQTLGTYADVSVVAGQNTTVTPSVAPTGASSITASTTNFTGLLTVDPTTGVVRITDAKQAGTYRVTVRISNTNVTSTFILTVTKPICSPGSFTPTNVATGGSQSVAIGDFNGDGKQDVALSTGGNISIRLGDGLGGFTSSPDVRADGISSMAIGDFNGDGNQDIAYISVYTFSILLGNGSGGFSSSYIQSFHGFGTINSFAICDFNGDGNQDFAIAATNFNGITYAGVKIFYGTGTGGVSSTTNVDIDNGIGNELWSLAIGDFNGDGKQDIVTIFREGGLYVIFGDGLGGFTMGVNPFVYGSESLAIGDFNADGKQDIAKVKNMSSQLEILLGNGGVSFDYGFIPNSIFNPDLLSVAVGDFNGDGKQDIVVSHSSSNNISILFGDGLGGFTVPTEVYVGISANSLAIGDFNGDGMQDIAYGNSDPGSVSILLGNGSENMAEINLQGNATTITNGDNTPTVNDHTDFGVVSVGNNLVRSFTIQNTGGLAPLTIPTGAITLTGTDANLFTLGGITLPTTIAAGDSATFTITFAPNTTGLKTAMVNIINDDCDVNLYKFAIQGGPAPTLGSYPNVSVIAGQNTTVTPSAAPTHASNITAKTNTNFTGVLSVDATTGVVRITDAKQTGSFVVTVQVPDTYTISMFTLTVTNPLCSPGTFSSPTNVAVGTQPQSAAIGDFNGDGKHDIATANYGSANVSILLGNGTSGFSSSPNVTVGTNPRSVAVGDFNGDGKHDIVTANYNSNDISIRLGDGLGSFSSPTIAEISVGTKPRSVAIGDFNSDGKQDIAVVNEGSANVSILLGNGSSGFSIVSTVNVGNTPRSVAIGDFNKDGKQDMVIAIVGPNTTSTILLGDGSGGFTAAPPGLVSGTSVAIGDFNGDGWQDIATLHETLNTVSISMGDGLGGFTVAPDVLVGGYTYSVAIGDFNGDGKQDIATANLNSNTLSIRLGDGTGNFTGSTDITLGTRPISAIMGDFNGDGKQDIAVSNGGSNNVYIVLGTGTGNLAEINLQGNATNIVDGDNTPTASDHTDFGLVRIGNSFVRTFTIQNTGTDPLTVPAGGITLTGTDASLFTVGGITLPTTIAAAGSVTFTLTFAPATIGLKTAMVNIANDDCDKNIYNFVVQGRGTTGCGNITLTSSINSGSSVNYTELEITATNQVSNATVNYQASKSVTLLPGFSATGNTFIAKIGGCN